MSIKTLADELERKGLEKKVAFNVLTQDKLITPGWLYFREKDSIESRYYAVVSSPEDPKIYVKQEIGDYIWGIRLPNTPKNSGARITKEIREVGLEVIQKYGGIGLLNIPENSKRGNCNGIEEAKKNIRRIKKEIEDSGLEVIQEYIPEFLL